MQRKKVIKKERRGVYLSTLPPGRHRFYYLKSLSYFGVQPFLPWKRIKKQISGVESIKKSEANLGNGVQIRVQKCTMLLEFFKSRPHLFKFRHQFAALHTHFNLFSSENKFINSFFFFFNI